MIRDLDEAIKHCKEIGCSDSECAKEHLQLAQWLTELKNIRELTMDNLSEASSQYQKRIEEQNPNAEAYNFDGAFHVLAMTRASDEELRKVTEGILRANIVTVEAPNYTSGIFRVNGYAFIELNDCISNEFEFTNVNTINDILDFKKHPIYIILLNDEYMISNITRIDRIDSFYKVEHTCIQLYTQIGSRYFPMICPKEVGKLYSLLHPFHKFSIYIPEEHYGKELFDECLYTVLSHIYPKYNEKLRGYDMNYINREYSSICTSWKKGMEKLRKEGLIDEMLFNRMPSPQLENVKNFIEKLPIKENM